MEKNIEHETQKFFKRREELRKIGRKLTQIDRELEQFKEDADKADSLSEKFEAFFKNNNETSWPTSVSEVGRKSVEAHIAARFGTENQSGDAHNIERRIGGDKELPTAQMIYVKQDGKTIQSKNDAVNHPKHYTGFSNGTEVIDITENLTFNTGNAVKYLARAGRTDGNTKGAVLEDLEKARWYVQREIERLEKDNNEAD